MSLEQIFLLAGIICIILWIFISLLMIFMLYKAYMGYRKIRTEAEKKIEPVVNMFEAVNGLPLKKLAPIIGVIPLVVKIYKSIVDD